jgi:hydrogenase maturation factor HypE
MTITIKDLVEIKDLSLVEKVFRYNDKLNIIYSHIEYILEDLKIEDFKYSIEIYKEDLVLIIKNILNNEEGVKEVLYFLDEGDEGVIKVKKNKKSLKVIFNFNRCEDY